MSLTQVSCAIFFLLGALSVDGFGAGGYGSDSFGSGGGFSAPKPYGFGYMADNYGGAHFRQEQGDSNGNVQGSYGYTDSQGLQRKVEYIANAGGFHASVKTNEPGTDGKEDPADVQMFVQPPPPGIQQKYSSGFGGSSGAGFGGGKFSQY